PSHRGVIVNGSAPTVEARQHDPNRMLAAYDHANTTLRTIERLSHGGFADIEQMHAWNVEFAEQSTQRERYEATTDAIQKAITFMKASGVTPDNLRAIHEAEVFTSHEGLIKDYELALARTVGTEQYATSAHMLWIGERTRDLDEFHVNYFAHIANPVASKVGPTASGDDVVGLCERLNPDKIPGRLTLITRMGKDAVGDVLPGLIHAVRDAGHDVVWVCDPMHGNTVSHASGRKTRMFDAVSEELMSTFQIHRSHDSRLDGVSLELTGQNVTECIGGSGRNSVSSLEERYDTTCDPRLNADQSLELAFLMADELAKDARK
ncbi:3-deoxy-7-phosphoheptulonate synthase, partial [Candidatus Saccharibacteria bacterium]|nr:3-deoxy-7-phosphoheptulonate synthase [Candidatus Saccharibacteria bacterium]